MSPRRGLFLDLDGTLAHSLPILQAVHRRFLGQYQVAATEEGFAAINGPPLSEIVVRLKAEHGLQAAPEELAERYRTLVMEAYAEVAPTEGAGELLETARRHCWRIAVVTSNSEALTRSWLARHYLLDWIDAIVGADPARPGKPAPDPYLAALALTDTQCGVSLAVEDSWQGALAALTAGLPTLMLRGDGETCPEGAQPVGSLAEVAGRIDSCLR